MATKLQIISNLMEQTTKRIRENPQDWAGFLQTAARLYKYPFEEQILIYAQRPDATACASIELWNKRMGRWVNRGAKSISLIDDSTGKTTLRHVFDVSDTHSLSHTPFRLWKMKEAYQEQVIEELANQFGDPDDTNAGFDSQLRDIIHHAVQDNMSDYLDVLLTRRSGSYLAALDNLNTEYIFREALTNTISYMVLSRLGFDTKASAEDLHKEVLSFNTVGTFMQLGGASSDISQMVLRQIERTIKSIEKQKHDVLDEAPIKNNINIGENERSGEHGNYIYKAGGLSDTRLDIGRTGDTANRQIRIDEKDVSQELQERDIRGVGAVEQTGQPLGGYRRDGQRTGESGNHKDGERAGRDGGTESHRSDEMGGHDEHDQTASGGNGASGADLQLNIPTELEQIESIEQAEDEKSSAFSVSQQNIDHVLLRGSNVEQSKIRIYQQYQKNATAKENIRFLTDEYGIGGASISFPDGTDGFEWHDTKGIRITVGPIGTPDSDLLLSWSKVNKRIGELIDAERYMSQSELAAIPKYEQWLMQRQQKAIEERAASDEQYQRLVTARAQGRYNLTLDSKVFVENQEYSILAVDAKSITLSDPAYPLLSRDMTRDAFMRELRASARNDYLLDLDALEETDNENNVQPEVGMEVELEGRTFVIDSVDTKWDKVSLRDVNFANATGYPIFRSESIAFVQYALEHQKSSHDNEPQREANADIKYELGFGRLGNGTTVWNRLHEVNGDYETIAHISDDGEIKYYRDDLPADVVQQIEADAHRQMPPRTAEPATQAESEKPSAFSVDDDDPMADVDPAYIRKQLAESGIVNGELVDPEKLDNDPFIRQVVADAARVSQNVQPDRSEPAEVKLKSIVVDFTKPQIKKLNYRITDDTLGHGGAKTKYGYNVAAIRTLQAIEAENRMATAEEQEVLARYVGWGCIPQAFDAENASWTNEYAELKDLLSDEEYESARGSTLNAHYTSPTVIKAIYQALENMGFKTGNVLDEAVA